MLNIGKEMNIFLCESSLHVAEATCIAAEDFEDSHNILVVLNASRVSDLNAVALNEAFDRHFVGNYKLNINHRPFPLVPDSIQSSLNRVLSYVSLLLMSTVLACLSIFISKMNLFFATRSPVLNNGLVWIRNHTRVRLYHFEEGISLYMKEGLKDRSNLSEFFFPLTLETILSSGAVDGVYCMRPDNLNSVYPDAETRKIKFYAHVELLTAVFEPDINSDQISADRPLFVLVTQPLVANNYLSDHVYQEKTAALVKSLRETYNVLVKPHPGEGTEQYEDLSDRDVTVLTEANYPVELLVWHLIGHEEVECVSVGSTGLSTALSNLATIPVEKYSFIEYYGLDAMDEKMRRYFAGCSVNYVSDPVVTFRTNRRFDPDNGPYSL